MLSVWRSNIYHSTCLYTIHTLIRSAQVVPMLADTRLLALIPNIAANRTDLLLSANKQI